tara:strand:+ start:2277 stop:2540 length:264 start_codon:yes stop_codon:yes gene_type:complete
MNRGECLAAAEAATKDREVSYGTPADNFTLIADLWSQYLRKRVSARDVGMMMVLLKVARLANGKHDDSLVDIAGYAAITSEIEANDK